MKEFGDMKNGIKTKIITIFLASVMLLLNGCGSKSVSVTDRPYDTNFATAKEFAEFWCGPCDATESHTLTIDDDDILIHKFTDSDYGFTYTVEERYTKYSNKSKPVVSYYCRDFDYYYLKAFLDKTDLSEITDKYEITIKQDELIESKNKDIYNIYIARFSMWTEKEISDLEGNRIMETVYNALDAFDSRDHFTKDPDCTALFFELYCAPREEEAAVGTPHHIFSGRYGYKQK